MIGPQFIFPAVLLLALLLFVPNVVHSFTVSPKSLHKYYRGRHEGNHVADNDFHLKVSASRSADNLESGYDLVVIGAGPVGVQSALAAASAPYKKSVCLIDAPSASGMLMDGEEDLSIGGPTGLFSKALRDTSKQIRVESLRGMGLREESVWNEIISNCLELASSNAHDVRRQLKFAGVTFLEGFASFPDSGETDSVYVSKNNYSIQTVKAKNILIATGSAPFRPGGIPFDGKRVFDSDSINQIGYLPKSIAITGSGIIAIEYAKIFRNLGADVTLIIRDRIPRNALIKIGLDRDVAGILVADLVGSGIKIERGCQVAEFDVPFEGSNAPIKLKLEGRNGAPLRRGQTDTLRCDAYLAAVGRKPNTANLNLPFAGINLDEYGGVLVDCELRTSAKAGNVFAAGDVLGRPFLASTGVAQGAASLVSIFGPPEDFRKQSISGFAGTNTTKGTDTTKDTDTTKGTDTTKKSNKKDEADDGDNSKGNMLICDGGISSAGASFDPSSLAANPFSFPIGVWSSPEAAYFGLTKPQLLDMGIEAAEGVALYAECLRGRVFSPTGLLKLVYEKSSGRILGVHIVGDDACELIHYGMELIKSKRTIIDLSNSLYSAVTFHELYKIAALAALDQAGGAKRRAAAGAYLQRQKRQSKNQLND